MMMITQSEVRVRAGPFSHSLPASYALLRERLKTGDIFQCEEERLRQAFAREPFILHESVWALHDAKDSPEVKSPLCWCLPPLHSSSCAIL